MKAQRALSTSLPHTQRNMNFGDRPSKTVANDVARASVTGFQYHRQTFQFCCRGDSCPQAISRDGVKGFLLQIEQKACKKAAATTCLMAWISVPLEHVFQSGIYPSIHLSHGESILKITVGCPTDQKKREGTFYYRNFSGEGIIFHYSFILIQKIRRREKLQSLQFYIHSMLTLPHCG